MLLDCATTALHPFSPEQAHVFYIFKMRFTDSIFFFRIMSNTFSTPTLSDGIREPNGHYLTPVFQIVVEKKRLKQKNSILTKIHGWR